jgi:hypothetical protein
MCLSCPNARRSAIHVPRLRTARDQALSALDMRKKDREALPRLQVIALTDYTAELDDLLTGLQAEQPEEGRHTA